MAPTDENPRVSMMILVMWKGSVKTLELRGMGIVRERMIDFDAVNGL